VRAPTEACGAGNDALQTLARSDMELGENPDLASGEEHGLAYREGSSGGGAAKGGGCGCN
jgi:hypothetical protein